ncbi:hypothetical protein [Desulfuromonas thiophila]|uniref:hypothetical protein n=1 Tax=Desulfuromonas thiophila TaxID=57664 RepID=UPI00115FDC21|nr:hypothetical protein [Desulfuromonas thiophila]
MVKRLWGLNPEDSEILRCSCPDAIAQGVPTSANKRRRHGRISATSRNQEENITGEKYPVRAGAASAGWQSSKSGRKQRKRMLGLYDERGIRGWQYGKNRTPEELSIQNYYGNAPV